MLKLKLQYFVHLMRRADSLEKTLLMGKIEGRGEEDERGWEGWMGSLTQLTWKWSLVRLFVTSWTAAHQAPPSMGFSRQEYWSGLPFPFPVHESEKCKVAQLCLTLSDPMDCSPPGSSFHGIFQARVLEWVAMPSSRGSSQPRDRAQVLALAGGFFATESPGKPRSHVGWDL